MSRHRKQARRSRDAPRMQRRSAAVAICPDDSWRVLIADGYRPLTQCPEVMMCVNVYAELIASMTIHLMENGEHGDTRVKDELSRMVDITPNPLMTHQGFMETIVRTLMTEGNQVTLPVFSGGLLMQLDPVPPSRVTFVPEGRGYRVNVGGASFAPDEVIHFALNPDPEYPWRGMGYEVALFDVVRSIREKNPQVPVIASGGKTGGSIRETIAAGANAITFTPPSTQELFKEMMERYRE